MAEDFGVKGRGKFYEETGVIRDVIQNHLLQIISYLAMEAPSSTYPEAVRDEQAEVLRTIRPMSPDQMVRGQFRGYRDEPGVNSDSYMATYAALRLHVDSWRWEGVPFYVRAGKSSATLVKTVLPASIVFIAFGFDDQLVPGATPKKPNSGLTAYSRPSFPNRIQAMSSPTVSARQPGIVGRSIARLVLPQADGNAAAT